MSERKDESAQINIDLSETTPTSSNEVSGMETAPKCEYLRLCEDCHSLNTTDGTCDDCDGTNLSYWVRPTESPPVAPTKVEVGGMETQAWLEERAAYYDENGHLASHAFMDGFAAGRQHGNKDLVLTFLSESVSEKPGIHTGNTDSQNRQVIADLTAALDAAHKKQRDIDEHWQRIHGEMVDAGIKREARIAELGAENAEFHKEGLAVYGSKIQLLNKRIVELEARGTALGEFADIIANRHKRIAELERDVADMREGLDLAHKDLWSAVKERDELKAELADKDGKRAAYIEVLGKQVAELEAENARLASTCTLVAHSRLLATNEEFRERLAAALDARDEARAELARSYEACRSVGVLLKQTGLETLIECARRTSERVRELEAEVERLRTALVAIRSHHTHDPVLNAVIEIAREALRGKP